MCCYYKYTTHHDIQYSNTMEPPYNGHFRTVHTCPLYGGVLNWEVKIYCKYNGRYQCGLSFIQRCPLLGVSINGGSTVVEM